MSLAPIIALLRQTIGLDVASVGLSLIERAVKQRVRANDLRDISQYAELLQRSQTELQSLVEVVVIPETFFFRYPESFAALRQIAEEQFLFGTRKIRALSVASSTGEEPYSIAMTLLDAGLPSEKFQIDAIDISAHLLDIGRLGMFGGNSFRGSDLKFREIVDRSFMRDHRARHVALLAFRRCSLDGAELFEVKIGDVGYVLHLLTPAFARRGLDETCDLSGYVSLRHAKTEAD